MAMISCKNIKFERRKNLWWTMSKRKLTVLVRKNTGSRSMALIPYMKKDMKRIEKNGNSKILVAFNSYNG